MHFSVVYLACVGTLDLNGRAEILLGQFERRYQAGNLQQQGGGVDSDKPWWDLWTPARTIAMTSNNNKKRNSKEQQVATKFAPYPWRVTRGSIMQAANESLKRLEQLKLAFAQLHWSTAKYQPLQEGALWEGIADVYDAGLCDAVGVSNYGP